jgi:murein DD-endopeptidase MepM/ murein hydrolase activator NlpD
VPAKSPGPAGSRFRTMAPVAVLTASLTVGAGVASAGGGGTGAPDPPVATDVVCVETCAGLRKAAEGSRVEVTGRHLENVVRVKFTGTGGRIPVDPTSASAGAVQAIVPAGAVTGRPKVVDAYGESSTSPATLTIVDASAVEVGSFKLNSADASPNTAYFDGRRKPQVVYVFQGDGPTDVRIQVVNRSTNAVVDTWVEGNRQPFTQNTATWNTSDEGGNTAASGKYRFRIGAVSGGAPESTDQAKFGYYGHIFPFRGPHGYGDGIGAGRGHRGQDIFGECGTPLVAARGGRVQWKAYQGSGAGYYIVIDGEGTGRDYVYMHMKSASPLAQGERVHTGDFVGRNGATGNASGCHLHFEIWSPPGWFEGGHFTNPTDDLRAWDTWS